MQASDSHVGATSSSTAPRSFSRSSGAHLAEGQVMCEATHHLCEAYIMIVLPLVGTRRACGSVHKHSVFACTFPRIP